MHSCHLTSCLRSAASTDTQSAALQTAQLRGGALVATQRRLLHGRKAIADSCIRVQDAWSLLRAVLLSEKALKASDVRAHLVFAHALHGGWLPLSAIVNTPAVRASCSCICAVIHGVSPRASQRPSIEHSLIGNRVQLDRWPFLCCVLFSVRLAPRRLAVQVQKYAKALKPPAASNAAFMLRLARELLQATNPVPEQLDLSPDGLQVRRAIADDEAAARALNPGFLELEMGSPADALASIVGERLPKPERVICTLVPADDGCDACEGWASCGSHACRCMRPSGAQ
jgi:hypothetical protein